MSVPADSTNPDQLIADLQRQLSERTRERDEAFARETAASEILQVISKSPTDVQPVLDVIAERAVKLCEGESCAVFRYDGTLQHFAAFSRNTWSDVSPDEIGASYPRALNRHFPTGLAMLDRTVVHTENIRTDDRFLFGANHVTAKFQAALAVPMMRDDQVIGAIAVTRMEAKAFTERQIELLKTFSAQAVIAIENVRLFTELRESLEQQTATAEVLETINRSPGDLQPVFEAILTKAMTLCHAAFGTFGIFDGRRLHTAATRGVPEAFARFRRSNPPEYGLGTGPGRLIAGEAYVHDIDVADTEAYRQGDPNARALVNLGGARTILTMALRKEGELLGMMDIYRQEVRPYSDKEIALLQGFVAQAVIAMENARLLGELRQRTEEVAELNRGLEARVAEQVEELGRVGRLKRFLAPQLAEMIVSQNDEKILESHRREIVVAFCDLRGYTAFTETAEPEEVLDFLREYHGALGPLVSQFEGTLDQFSGDGIMVFFNDPVPIPDPAERAVKMAVAMRDAASTLIAAWRERGRQLGFGVGIAQGYATLGQIGFAERSGYTAIGTVCNVAARLCGEAKDGQILLGQRVTVALKGSVATEPVGALALKGLTQPVIAYNVPLIVSQPALRVIDGDNR